MKLAPIISLGLSAVLGIAAVFLGRYYMTNDSNDVAAQVSAPTIEMASVLVASAAIEPGEQVSASNVKTLNWPATSIPEGTLGRKSDLETALYARGLILPGEPILLEKLDAEANTVTLAAAIEPGMRAVSITVRSDTGVSGFVLPGDRVDVNEFIEEEPGQSAATLGGEAVRVNSRLIARPILKNVKVLAIDQTFEPGLEGARPSSTVTLEVTQDGALRLGAAGVQGSLGLALIGRAEKAEVITEVKADPAPRKAVVRRAAPRPATTANVRVINGDKETLVTAPVSKPILLTEEPS